MTVPKLLRYCLVLLLVFFQLQAGAVSVGTIRAEVNQTQQTMPMVTDCLDHKGDHCQMADTASQARGGCLSSGCGSLSILPGFLPTAPMSNLALTEGWVPADFPPQVGHPNPLERPPSL